MTIIQDCATKTGKLACRIVLGEKDIVIVISNYIEEK